MKKLAIFAISSILALGLVACGDSSSSSSSSSASSSSASLAAGSKPDGTYTAKVDDAFAQDLGNGWVDQLTVTYKDGKIISAEFASYNAEGTSKENDSTYPMSNPAPSVWMEELDKNIVEASSPEDIITVAGASTSSENARILLAGIEENGIAGETIVVIVPFTAD